MRLPTRETKLLSLIAVPVVTGHVASSARVLFPMSLESPTIFEKYPLVSALRYAQYSHETLYPVTVAGSGLSSK
jgi:hypothetical protein